MSFPTKSNNLATDLCWCEDFIPYTFVDSLQALRLCGNKMCQKSVGSVSLCIWSVVQQLWLERCDLTGDDIEVLAEGIRLRHFPVRGCV